MKFSWGTGILIFLIVFVLANLVFVVFAFKQEVNLVDEDYYERGVDYGDQMEVISRSEAFENDVVPSQEDDLFHIRFRESLYTQIDSGDLILYRPSSKKYDLKFPLDSEIKGLTVSRKDVIRGRYIVKMDWYSQGLRYELNIPVSIK